MTITTSRNISSATLMFKKYSAFTKCLREIAYCLRFKNNATSKNTKIIDPQSPIKMEKAKFVLIKTTQAVYFSCE